MSEGEEGREGKLREKFYGPLTVAGYETRHLPADPKCDRLAYSFDYRKQQVKDYQVSYLLLFG